MTHSPVGSYSPNQRLKANNTAFQAGFSTGSMSLSIQDQSQFNTRGRSVEKVPSMQDSNSAISPQHSSHMKL